MEGATGPGKLSAGTMLDDKYRIERLIAVGGMGAVYLGTHIKLRKRVAIKVLDPQLSSGPMVERFHREAITASQIGHEGIAQVTDLGTSVGGDLFLVMEYLEGESLAARLRGAGPLAVEDACEIGCGILSPLEAAHRAGIIHRDLKPDNVFLVRQSRGELVKLLDFGISRTSGPEAEFRLTMTGLVLGTPFYMSPEQARGESQIATAADLYAFGVMLYEMLIGDVPIRAENYNQLMYRVTLGDFAPPSQRRPGLPAELERIILHAMAQHPAQRPASAAELEHALLAFCRPAFRERASGRISTPALALPTPSPRARTGRSPDPRTDDAMLTGPTISDEPAPVSLVPPAPTTEPAGDPGRAASPQPRSRARWWVAATAIVVAGAAAGAIAMFARDREAPPAGRREPMIQPPPAPVIEAPPAPAPPVVQDDHPAVTMEPAEPEPATITLRLAVRPAGAAITLDGVKVDRTELVVPKDSAPHRLRITAPGYLAYDQPLELDESRRVVVQLRPAAGPPRGKLPPRAKPERDRIESQSPYE